MPATPDLAVWQRSRMTGGLAWWFPRIKTSLHGQHLWPRFIKRYHAKLSLVCLFGASVQRHSPPGYEICKCESFFPPSGPRPQ